MKVGSNASRPNIKPIGEAGGSTTYTSDIVGWRLGVEEIEAGLAGRRRRRRRSVGGHAAKEGEWRVVLLGFRLTKRVPNLGDEMNTMTFT
ncbi:hypothetical protein Q3G72_028905 [Acer saccharum]|nr:hypothetical protein Q3G72_028905 [Acer saccharum]